MNDCADLLLIVFAVSFLARKCERRSCRLVSANHLQTRAMAKVFCANQGSVVFLSFFLPSPPAGRLRAFQLEGALARNKVLRPSSYSLVKKGWGRELFSFQYDRPVSPEKPCAELPQTFFRESSNSSVVPKKIEGADGICFFFCVGFGCDFFD